MDPKLTEQLQQMLTGLLASAQDASVWAKGQVPLLVQEKILFGRVNETAQLVLVVACFIASVVLCRRCLRRLVDGADEEIGWFGGIIVTGIASVGFLFAGAEQLRVTAMVWFAPRLYIVEWLMSQIHK